jgi:acyl carrier protein phosphodiesterase
VTLIDFLLDRRTDEIEARIISDAAWEAVEDGMTPEQSDRYMSLRVKSMAADWLRLHRALGNVGWAILAALSPRRARVEAARFSWHPDYRPEWRP